MTHQPIWTRPRTIGEPVFIGGHRGASSEAGENSKEAFEHAVAAGADFIEFDWRLTHDGMPIVFHDDELQRLYGDERAIGDIDFADLRAIDPRIMTVAEALETVRGRISVLLDTKITEPAALSRGLDLVAPHLGNDTAVAFGTRSLDASEVVRRRLPESPVLGLFGNPADFPALRAMGGSWARLWEEHATQAAIADLQKLGLKVIIMAGLPTNAGVGVITPQDMHSLLARHPDAVMMNDVRLGLAAREAFPATIANSPAG
ncbi:hypothetical protein HGO38_13115 [Rhizobium sp. CG5]|uniref:glycerophosphodiester phosphodiesterase n=1 Tax=Rhizobium sp. CG5 TaxID=2726076 RepID=UPI00203413E8|nr:glycerophosphodiester phosphodiesterase family protein [Rhizobium sp. CG5]MCM2474414.1 hypothetical protein [Rhizobium sp. CG5]